MTHVSPFQTQKRFSARHLLRRARRNIVVRVEEAGERLVIARHLRRRGHALPGKQRSGGLVITAAGGGSVGDEAMYQAVTLNAPKPVTVLHRATDDLLAPASELGAADLVFTDLVYGRGVRSHLKAVREFAQLLDSAQWCAVVGADMMDGIYNDRAAARRFRMASIAARLGAASSVLGFSWVDSPTSIAKRALKNTRSDVALLARDPVSGKRMRRDGGKNVIDVADLAFLTEISTHTAATDAQAWLDSQTAEGRKVVLINANPRIAVMYPGQDEAYTSLVDDLVAAGYSCLALPHDSRHGAESEIAYLQRLFSGQRDTGHVFVPSDVMLPGEVSRLALQCVLAVSGRMHLVILSAVAGIPSVALEYQDKFEGLYDLFGFDLRVRAGDVRKELRDATFAALAKHDELRAELQAALPRIVERANRGIPR